MFLTFTVNPMQKGKVIRKRPRFVAFMQKRLDKALREDREAKERKSLTGLEAIEQAYIHRRDKRDTNVTKVGEFKNV